MHHVHTNDVERDSDASVAPVLRFGQNREWVPANRWQLFYGPIVMSLFSLQFHITSYFSMLNTGGIKLPELFFRSPHRWISLGIRAVWLYTFFIHPCMYYNWKIHLASMLVKLLISGAILISIFVINHNTVRTRIASEKMGPTKDWAAIQVVESVNFSPNSEFWTWWSGGLNYQIEHHLFPTVSDRYYPMLAPMVKEECAKRNIPYVCFDSFMGAYIDFWKLLADAREVTKKSQ